MLRVLARDIQHLERALNASAPAGDIDRTESIVVLSNLVDRAQVQG